MRRHWEWVWAPALYLAVTLLLYREVWLGEGGQLRWFGWDCPESYWPDLAYYAGAIRHGEWPLWNPFDRGGYAFYADMSPGLYYPVTWVIVGAGAVAGEVPAWAVQVKALFHLGLAGLATHAYLRSRRVPAVAAALGGVISIACAPAMIHKQSALAWPTVWMPLVWLATDRVLERAAQPGWWRRGILLGGLVGLAGAAGPPPGFFYLLVGAFVYGAWRFLVVLGDAAGQGGAGRAVLDQARGLAVAAAVAIALLLVIVMPGMETAALSWRANPTTGFAVENALEAAETLPGMIAPALGTESAYTGLVPLVLALVAVAFAAGRDRGAPVLFLVTAAFLLVLSFGDETPVLPWLVEHLPGFGMFRDPTRYKIPAHMMLVAAVAHGLAALVEAPRERRDRALVVLAAALAFFLALVVRVALTGAPGPSWTYAGAGPAFGALVLLVGGAALGAVVLAPGRWRVVAAAGVVVIAYLDTDRMLRPSSIVRAEAPPSEAAERMLPQLAGVERDVRLYDEYVFEQRVGSRHRVRDFRGYPSGDPFEESRYGEVLRLARSRPQILEAFNVRWILHGPHSRNGYNKNWLTRPPGEQAPEHFRDTGAARSEALHPAPLVAWYGAVELVKNETAAMTALLAAEEKDGVRRRAVVEKPDVPRGELAPLRKLSPRNREVPPSVPGRVLRYGANRIDLEVDAPAAGLVVLNEKQWPGWRVWVDGRERPALRANVLLRAVRVPAGRHVIVWQFVPDGYATWIALWSAGLTACLAGALWPFGARLRRRLLRAR